MLYMWTDKELWELFNGNNFGQSYKSKQFPSHEVTLLTSWDPQRSVGAHEGWPCYANEINFVYGYHATRGTGSTHRSSFQAVLRALQVGTCTFQNSEEPICRTRCKFLASRQSISGHHHQGVISHLHIHVFLNWICTDQPPHWHSRPYCSLCCDHWTFGEHSPTRCSPSFRYYTLRRPFQSW